jgi:hypothetical protein
MLLVHLATCIVGSAAVAPPLTFDDLTAGRGRFDGSCRVEGEPFVLGASGEARCEVLVERDAPIVVRTALEGLERVLRADAGLALEHRAWTEAETLRPSIVALVGEGSPLLPRLRRAGLATPTSLGAQGFVLERLALDGVPVLAIWSPSAIGCRYGIIELTRSLSLAPGEASTRLARVVSQPHFPLRIAYLNFAEHLQNRYNVNFVYDTPECRWDLDQWRRYIDMLAAMRYNVFEFWLVPTLFDPSALEGAERTERFADTMCEVIRYAHEQGLLVEMLQAVNTVGPDWRFYCPNVPEEREMILRLWEFWSQRLAGVDIIGLFPGDPGGCTRNGCDYRTYVDLCVGIARRTESHRPYIYDVETWGTPFWGWGLEAWQGGPDRAREAFDYFEKRLGDFPSQTFVGICMGLNSDALGSEGGGDATPYVREVAATRPVATWDYAASEGEGTVLPRFRVARILDRRQREAQLPYVGGINYTMTPALNQVQAFAAAECYWDPERTVEGILRDYSRLAFGEASIDLGERVFPYTEVVTDWGGGGWSADLEGLSRGLGDARVALETCAAPREGRLPLFPSAAYAREELLWYVGLFAQLARTARWIDEARGLVAELGGGPADQIKLDEAATIAASAADDRGRRLSQLIARIRDADMPALRAQYWEHVYGIYDAADRPVDPRAWGATDQLLGRFGYGFVQPAPEEAAPPVLLHNHPSRLADLLETRGEPYLCLDLGNAISERPWKLTGWPAAGVTDDESWRASMDGPGVALLRGFRDEGYRWLIVRATDDLMGGRKSFSVNGRLVGTFVRPGEAVRWTTQQYELPEGLLASGTLEIRATEAGIGLGDLALTRRPLTAEELAGLDP